MPATAVGRTVAAVVLSEVGFKTLKAFVVPKRSEQTIVSFREL